MAVAISLLPLLACLVAAALVAPAVSGAGSLAETARIVVLWLPAGVAVGYLALAFLVWLVVRLLSWGLVEGHHPVHGRQAWQAWSVLRVLDEARSWLFPLYSSSLTPAWLRALGAKVGKDVEASTVLLIPSLTSISDGAFLADDTLLGGYELGGGWLRVGRVKIGKHAFLGQLRHGRARPQGAQAGTRRRAVGRAASHAGQERHVVARQPSGPAAPAVGRRRRRADVPPVARSAGGARVRRAPPRGAAVWSRGCSSSASPWSSWPWPPTPDGGAPPRSPVWC